MIKAYGATAGEKYAPPPNNFTSLTDMHMPPRQLSYLNAEFCFHGSVEEDDRREKHMQKAGVSEYLHKDTQVHK